MARDSKLNIVLGAKDEASKKIGKIKGSLDKLPGSVTAIAAAWASWRGITELLDMTVMAAAKQEVIFTKLENTIKIIGRSYQQVKPEIDSFLVSMQDTTRFGDTDMAPVLQNIIQLTGDLEGSFEGAQLAADIAASGLWNLNTAGRLVTQAMTGNVEMLGRYIPELKSSAGLIDANMTATEKWAVAKELLNKKFSGMAAGDMDTFLATTAQLKNELGDLGEKVGDRFLGFLKDVTSELAFSVKGLNEFLDSLIKFTPEYVKQQREATKALNEAYEEQRNALTAYTEFRVHTENKTADELREMLIRHHYASKTGTDQYYTALYERLRGYHEEQIRVTREHHEQALKDKVAADIEFETQDIAAKIEHSKIVGQVYRDMFDELVSTGLMSLEELNGYFEEYLGAEALTPDKPIEAPFNDEWLNQQIDYIEDVHDAAFKEWVDGLLPQMQQGAEDATRNTTEVTSDMVGASMDGMTQMASHARTTITDEARDLERLFSRYQRRMVDNMVDSWFGARKSIKEIFKDMAKDFLKLFINAILDDLNNNLTPRVMDSLGSWFDTYENDMMAMRQGRDFAHHFMSGVMTEFASVNPNRIVSPMLSRGIAPVGAGGNNIHIHIDTFIGEKSWVQSKIIPVIEEAIDDGRSNILKSRSIANVAY